MQRLLILAPLLMLLACAGEDSVESDNPEQDQLSQTDSNDVDLNVNSDTISIAEVSGPTPFDITDFPRKWTQLSQDEERPDEMYIFHYCDAETAFLQLEPNKGEDWQLFIAYGQDGEEFELFNFEAEQLEMELYQCVAGSFELRSLYNEEIKPVTFVWNQDLQFCSFDGLFFDPPFFVNEEDRGSYEEIQEDCEGLWE